MNIGELNQRITVTSWGASKSASAGLSASEKDSWTMWAKAEQRSGSAVTNEGQQVWNYDQKFTVRREASRPIQSNMTVDYKGARYMINEVAIDKPGREKFYVLRCTKTDEDIEGL